MKEITPEERRILQEKIERIRAGEAVRPPKDWFDRMIKQLSLQYPRLPGESETSYRRRLGQIAGGIWHRMSKESQIGILEKIIRGEEWITLDKELEKIVV